MGENIDIKKEIKYIEIFILIFALAVVAIVLGKYSIKKIEQEYDLYKTTKNLQSIKEEVQNYLCPEGTLTLEVEGGKVCRVDGISASYYRDIFDTYTFYSNGTEDIFKFLSRGDVATANTILEGNFVVNGFEPISFSRGISWNEDPYNNSVWRLEFYGLRSLRHLFFAFNTTNDAEYLKKAEDISIDFIDKDKSNVNSWKDFNAVSFRALFFTKLWWQLRENNLLTYDSSTKILKSIQKHAEFLSDPNHYDKGSVNDVNEAGALYAIAVNFPDFPESEKWLKIATERLNSGVEYSVDKDGVVVEKSPSYQFSMLEKYWEVYLYSQGQNQQLSDVFTDRLQNMILYSTHVLQPNGQLPIINATTKKEISYTGIYKEIADTFPEFKYVITKGTSGTKPEALNKVFAEAGQSILRSSWGDKKDFLDQVQVIFEAGPNRSSKNDLNALSFNLYGAGRNLITDSGNYTNTNGLYKNYFHGTLGSNTVVVDNKSQNEGVALLGEFKEGKNYVSQSAFSDLYDGVTHKRTLVLVENKYLIVIDKLESGSEHEYKQVFHLFPGADIKSDDTGVFVNQGDKEIMSVFQLENEGIYFNSKFESNNPIDGICSEEAGVILPCHSLQYSKKTKNATFVTLIQIGKHEGSLSYNFDGESIKIKNSSKNITIDLEEVAGSEEKIVVSGSARPPFNKVPIVGVDALKWNTKDQNEAGGKVQTISDDTGSFLDFRTPDNGKNVSANIPVELDLSTSNLMIRMKVRERPSVNTLQVSFFTNGGKGSMAIDLRNSYREEDNQGWLDISIGKGSFRKTAGRWTEYGEGFDWSDIDKLQITFAAQPGVVAGLQIASISMTPQEKEGEVVIIFDDGYESILPAVEVMNSFGFKGNIAVIADRLETNQRGYLSLKQLQTIKNDYGWDIINHTEHHLSAVSNYANKGKLEEYEQDVLNGAKYLIKNDLNTTPNWMVYPHGATDEKIKSVIKKYYLFARTTINQPESYPFADPYSVKTISADTGESSNSSIVKFIPVADIMSAVVDAKKYKLPLFITFHRINSSSTDRPGYNINEFKKLMSLIAQEKIKVVTLRQFDINHNIPEQKMELVKKVPAELRVKVVITDNSFFSNILNSLISIFRKK